LSVSGNHANKYPDAVDKATRPGISTFYKHEIDTLIREEMWKQPKAILKILTKRRTDGVPGYDAPLPELRQIRNYKRNMNTPHNNEYEEVLKRIKDLSTGLEELMKQPHSHMELKWEQDQIMTRLLFVSPQNTYLEV